MCEVIAAVFAALGAGAAFGAGLMVFERQRQVLHDVLDASWFFVSAGLGLWLIAEVLRLALWESPWMFPRFYVTGPVRALGQVLVLAGLYRGARPFISLLNDADSKRVVKASYIVPLALCAALIASIHLRVLRGLTLEGLSSTILSTVLVFLDVALLAVTLKVVAFFYGGRPAKAFALLPIGLALLAVGDLSCLVAGGYVPSLLRAAGYTVMAAGAYFYSRHLPVI